MVFIKDTDWVYQDEGMYIGNGKTGYLKHTLIAPLKLEVKGCELGYGVFAREDIKEGEIVEECVIFGDRIPAIYENWIMSQYTYRGLPTAGLPDKADYVLLMGYGCLYNHDEEKQNIEIAQDNDYERIMRVTALKDIKAGDQLYWNYGYDPAKRDSGELEEAVPKTKEKKNKQKKEKK